MNRDIAPDRSSAPGLTWQHFERPHALDLAFFRSGSPDPIEAACRLARFYGCAPTDFLREDPAGLAAIITTTIELMEEEIADHG